MWTALRTILVLHSSVRAFHAPITKAAKAASCAECGTCRRTRTRARPCRTTCLRAQQNDGFDPRFGWFGLELGFVLADAAKQAVRGKTIVGDLVIAGTDNEKLKIRQSQSYVLRRIYWQGVDDTGSVRQVDAEALDDPCPAAGYEQYLSLYSPRFHRESGPVVARLEECRPTRLREEIAEAAVLGIPGLFWVFVSAQLLEYGRQTGRM